jgi:hypothetical protein
MLPFPMVHTGYPSFGPCSGAASARHSLSSLCRGGSSEPLFSPHCISFSAFLSLPSPLCFDPLAVNSPSLTPLSAALPNSPQQTEIKASLSPFPATLTDFANYKPFVCHSYKKTGGWGEGLLSPCVSAESVNGTRRCDPTCSSKPFTFRTYAKRNRNPFRMNTSKTQHLNSFRIRTYEKTPAGPLSFVSLPLWKPRGLNEP